MKHYRRADQVKMCNVVADRPGIIKPFMMPTVLKNQVRSGAKRTDIEFKPTGKTLVGGTQWSFVDMQRPGIAKPLLIAKKEQEALAKGLAVEAKLASPGAKAVAQAKAVAEAKQIAKLEADSQEVEKVVENGGMSGYGYRW